MMTVEFITALFYEVDEQLRAIPKHPEAHLWPSEVVTLGLLHALKGGGNRPFYRWLTRDYRIFPRSLSRLLRITLWEHWCSRAERAWKCLPTFCVSSLEVVMASPTRRESPSAAHLGSASASLPCPGRGRSIDRAGRTPARPPPPSPPSCRHPWSRRRRQAHGASHGPLSKLTSSPTHGHGCAGLCAQRWGAPPRGLFSWCGSPARRHGGPDSGHGRPGQRAQSAARRSPRRSTHPVPWPPLERPCPVWP